MSNPADRLTQRQYAWAMLALLVIHFVVAVLVLAYPSLGRFGLYFLLADAGCIAVFTGARFADAGYRRWWGFVVVVVSAVVVPFLSVVGLMSLSGIGRADVAGYETAVLLALLTPLLLVIAWAASQPTAVDTDEDDVAQEFHDDIARIQRRVEPHF